MAKELQFLRETFQGFELQFVHDNCQAHGSVRSLPEMGSTTHTSLSTSTTTFSSFSSSGGKLRATGPPRRGRKKSRELQKTDRDQVSSGILGEEYQPRNSNNSRPPPPRRGSGAVNRWSSGSSSEESWQTTRYIKGDQTPRRPLARDPPPPTDIVILQRRRPSPQPVSRNSCAA